MRSHPEQPDLPNLEADAVGDTPLQSWKEIAAYLDRDVRTARRWEQAEGLPVRRHRSGARSSVYAYRGELDAWRAKRKPKTAAGGLLPRYAWGLAGLVVLVGSSLWLVRGVGVGPVVDAQEPGKGIRAIEVCESCDWSGSSSPDGRYLSMADWSSGDLAIYDLETREQRRLTKKGSWNAGPGEPGGSVFSPDGRLVAYSWRVKADEDWLYDLRVVDTDDADAEPRVVYSNPEFYYIEPSGWSPSDEILIYGTRDDGSTVIGFVAVETGEFKAVKTLQWTPPLLSLSPDGRWIGYDIPSTEHQPHRDVYLLAADGSRETLVTGHRANDVVVGFTPGSDVLLFASDRTGSNGLWAATISSEGVPGEPRLLQRDFGTVAPLGVARDGSLFYARAIGARDVYTAEVDLATARLLSHRLSSRVSIKAGTSKEFGRLTGAPWPTWRLPDPSADTATR